MKYLLLVFTITLFSCGVSNAVFDYDEQRDFTQYKTYNYFPEMQVDLNELDIKRMLKVSDSLLVQKGLTKSETPDLYINFKIRTQKTPPNNNVGIGVGGGNGGINIGLGGAIPIGGPTTFLEVTTDFIDVSEDELVWQAIVEKRFNANARGDKRIQFFQTVLQSSYVKYPPKTK